MYQQIVESIEQNNDAEEAQSSVCEIWLGRGDLNTSVLRSPPGARMASVGFDVGHTEGKPGEEGRDGRQVPETLNDDVGPGTAWHVRQQRQTGGDENAVRWNTGLGARHEEMRSLLVLGQREEVPRSAVQEGAGGRGGPCQDDDFDQAWQSGNSCTVGRNGPRRSRSTSCALFDGIH
jgi:hypothetical protein